MKNREVRLYTHEDQSTIVGFNASATVEDQESIHEFFSILGHTSRDMLTRHSEGFENSRDKKIFNSLGSVSVRHVEVRPPLKDDEIPEFAGWCKSNVDPYNESGYLIDNRVRPPLNSKIYPHLDGDMLARW